MKSEKTHMKKVLGDAVCTYEEMSTVMVQIEAIFNSWPLCPLTNDVEDLDVLTPMHFLTGSQYVPVVGPVGSRMIKRYEYVQSKYHDISQRYKKEYLSRLQTRPKWISPQPNIKVGQLVLEKEDNLANTKWPLERITKGHPGPDGKVRVVTLKMKDGEKNETHRENMSITPGINFKHL